MAKKKAKVKVNTLNPKPMQGENISTLKRGPDSMIGSALSAANPVYQGGLPASSDINYKSADLNSNSIYSSPSSLPASNVYGGGLKPSDVNAFAAKSPALSNIADQTAAKEVMSSKTKYTEGSAYTKEGGYAPVKKNAKGVYTEEAVATAVEKSIAKAKAKVKSKGRSPQSESPKKSSVKVLKLTGDKKKAYEEYLNKKNK
jgi:hypothetical protein